MDERFPFVESQYSKVTDNAEFQIFDGVGHTVTQKMEDTLSTFHRKNAPVNDTQISNVRIDPSVIRQSRTHTLTFNVSNLSSDGEKDEFAIEIPETVDIKSVDNVTADLLSDPDYKTADNNIIFSINPTGAKIGIVEITVEMTLSQSNY